MRLGILVAAVLVISTATGCAPRRSYVETRKCDSESVDIYFATDRHIDRDDPVNTSGYSLSDQRSVLAYGRCVVCIPQQHKMGEIELPFQQQIYASRTTWLHNGSEKYFSIADLKCLKSEAEFADNVCDDVTYKGYGFCDGDFFEALNTALNAPGKSRTVLVYVHGFNNTFSEAAMRAAQIAYDIQFKGVTIIYSWPSRKLLNYSAAEGNSEWTQADLTTFLNQLLCRTGNADIYLLAHSMGTRILMRSLTDMILDDNCKENTSTRCSEPKKVPITSIAGVILAASDLDYDHFNRSFAPLLANKNIHTTIYASSKDIALDYSEFKHKYRRVGDVDKSPFIKKRFDTIDISQASSSMIGHSDFAESPLVLNDLGSMINCGLRAEQRKTLAKHPSDKYCSESGTNRSSSVYSPECYYWTIEPYLYDLQQTNQNRQHNAGCP